MKLCSFVIKKMALEKLPNDIQHLLCASTQINSYKRAIEELVYNSLDASSTSIALRIHIEEDTIQVVDNGHGITKRNFGPLGQKYMTSKYVDMNTLKSVPNKYGFRGESLANIIKLSQNVEIISRHESGEETQIKYFCNGKEQIVKELTTRPSKGTTVEVKGFLYNLSIQKKATDSMNIIQDIKTFLEQLSLVHSHISLSLRDDSKNEIVFKMHKKRDIYQTLSSLFGIDKSDFQELKVEKQQYKVIGFIGNSDKEIGRNWVFLNGKFISNSKLHKIINDIMAKSINRDQGNRRAAKIKKTHKDYPDLFLCKNTIPFYFIFVTCPYNEYDVSYTPKKSVLEFKDWEQIKKLLEKLIKFYTGDIHLKEVKKSDTKLVSKEQEGTRLEVRKIMERILGGNSKKLGVSQMQKGIKGKRIKRNSKKNHVYKTLNSVVPPKNNNRYTKSDNTSNSIELNAIETHLESNNNNLKIKKKTKSVQETIPSKTIECLYQDTATKHNTHINKEGSQKRNYKNKEKLSSKKISKISNQCRTAITEKEKLKYQNNSNERTSVKKIKPKKDSLYERFENPTESLKMRWDIMAKKAENVLERRKKRVTEMIAKQTERHGNKLNNNKIDTAHKNVRNIYNLDYTPIPSMFNRHNTENHILKKKQEKPFYKTTYDLVHTILKSQQETNPCFKRTYSPIKVKTINKIPNTNNSNIQLVSKLTFESHNYYNVDRNHDIIAQKFHNKLPNKHLMTEKSRDNFKLLSNKSTKMHNPYNRYLNTKKTFNKRTMVFKIGDSIKDNRYEETSYTIEFSEKNNHEKNDGSNLDYIIRPYHENNRIHTSNNYDTWCYEANCNTYTVLSSAFFENSVRVESNPLNLNMHVHRNTYIMSNSDDTLNKDKGKVNRNSKTFDNEFIETNNESMFMFSSNSQRRNSEVIFGTTIEPINICETILSNDSDKILLNNNELIHNIFNDIEECVEEPNFNEGKIKNHDDEQNNYIINEDLNINVCKEKSDYTRDCQAMEIESNDKGIEECINDTNFDKREIVINHVNGPNKDVNNEDINLNMCEEKSDYTKDCQDTDIERNDPCESRQKVSHHFDIITNSNNLTSRQLNNDKRTLRPILTSTIYKNLKENRFNQNSYRVQVLQDMKQNKQQNKNTKNVNEDQNEPINLIDSNTIEKDMNNFILKNRLHFVPKGMSPIFANCNNKDICDYNLEKDYYEDKIYNNFANDVQVHSEVFKPRIENMARVNNKDIDKVNNKLDKDNASLIFNGQSLKEAKVLGQVDGKFIAAVMKGKCKVQDEISEFLILFDQHAVHERIRLENNLSDYIVKDKWKSIPLDDISLKISKDEVLYLHNYMEKFDIFGLQWTFLSNCEISINTIPEAILGKNPRPVDKIIKAVKNLISEEINMIKLQKGCVSLYPKSIMDLVFSEACRYAIKFGDKLSNNDCMELLNALSKCKTPFQCAHGRPVMAVLMDYTFENHKYEVTSEKLDYFKRRNNK